MAAERGTESETGDPARERGREGCRQRRAQAQKSERKLAETRGKRERRRRN